MKVILVFSLILMLATAMVTSAGGCICTDDYRAVCGQDGRTYSNRCQLNCAGVKQAYNGRCGSGGNI